MPSPVITTLWITPSTAVRVNKSSVDPSRLILFLGDEDSAAQVWFGSGTELRAFLARCAAALTSHESQGVLDTEPAA